MMIKYYLDISVSDEEGSEFFNKQSSDLFCGVQADHLAGIITLHYQTYWEHLS
jgi:hypothetical protein